MSVLLCFSGQIGSGKSSVSAAVAEALRWRRTGFGVYLRGEIARFDIGAKGKQIVAKP